MERWENDLKLLKTSTFISAVIFQICFILGIIFVILGVVGELIKITLGLNPISWFLLAISAFVVAAYWGINWAASLYVNYLDSKSK